MQDIKYLKQIISSRDVAICLQGSSIEELESRIGEFKDFNICWTSLGVFDIIQNHILNKIGRELEIVFDCATVPHARVPHYEKNVRVPRLETFLKKSINNVWITSYGLIRDSVALHYPHFLYHYDDKILLVDKLFPQDNIPYWMNVANSVTLFIGALIAGGAKNVILFGLDGYVGDVINGVNSYYKPEVIASERMSALGSVQDPGINRDSETFEFRFRDRWADYIKLFNWNGDILNCSPKSIYNVPPKITYDKLLERLNESTK